MVWLQRSASRACTHGASRPQYWGEEASCWRHYYSTRGGRSDCSLLGTCLSVRDRLPSPLGVQSFWSCWLLCRLTLSLHNKQHTRHFTTFYMHVNSDPKEGRGSFSTVSQITGSICVSFIFTYCTRQIKMHCKGIRDKHLKQNRLSEIWGFKASVYRVNVKCTLVQAWSKVKCTLVQALRLCTGRTAHRGSRGIALPFHDHGTRKEWGVSVTPWPLFTPRKDPVPIVQEAGWAPGPVWTVAENLAPPGFDLRTVRPVVSRYTDWAIPAHSVYKEWCISDVTACNLVEIYQLFGGIHCTHATCLRLQYVLVNIPKIYNTKHSVL